MMHISMQQLSFIMKGLAIVYHLQLATLESTLVSITINRGHEGTTLNAQWRSSVEHIYQKAVTTKEVEQEVYTQRSQQRQEAESVSTPRKHDEHHAAPIIHEE